MKVALDNDIRSFTPLEAVADNAQASSEACQPPGHHGEGE